MTSIATFAIFILSLAIKLLIKLRLVFPVAYHRYEHSSVQLAAIP